MLPEFLRNKAREICYALVRISCFINRADLRQRLERLAFVFVEDVAAASADKNNKKLINNALKDIIVLDTLVRIGHSLYEIEPINATILVRELDAMNPAIRQFGNLDEQLPDLETFFSQLPSLDGQLSSPVIKKAASTEPIQKGDVQQEKTKAEIWQSLSVTCPTVDGAGQADPAIEMERAQDNPAIRQPADPAIRQSAIILMAKEQNELHIKDLVAAFPEVSERTLRYDLQRLCEQGVIKRVGFGGPATFYRLQADTQDTANIIMK